MVQEKFSLTTRKFVLENERGEQLYLVEVPLGSSLCMAKEQHFKVNIDEVFVLSFTDRS